MNKNILLAISAVFMVGCATMAAPPRDFSDCPGNNKKDIRISYGDGFINVKHYSQASRSGDQKIVFDLRPQNLPQSVPKYSRNRINDAMVGSGRDFANVAIRIKGKTASDAEVIDLHVAANDSDERKIVCLGNMPEGRYRFKVEVPDVGTIDPIIDIIP